MTETPMTITPFEDAHEDGVVALWRTVFPDDPPWNEPASVIAAKREVHPELFFIALEADRVIGTAMGGYDGHRGWVYTVAVHPEARRGGIGTALMHAVESALEARGCIKLNLQIRAGNEAVAAFYRHLGYAVEERVSMGKRLGAAAAMTG